VWPTILPTLRPVNFLLISCNLALALGFATGCARRNFFQADAKLAGAAVPAEPTAPGRVWATAGRHYNKHSKLYKVFLGPHHRAVWAAPVQAPVLDLHTALPQAGMLTPTKLGGGFQSTSLSLVAPDSHPFVLRSMDKDPSRILPKIWRKTFIANFMRDATSAGNPYGALVIPPLAQALGVPHCTPQLFYVAADENGLGSAEANERLRGKLVLLEQKFVGSVVRSPQLPTARKFVDDEDMREQLYTNPAARPDGHALLRARMLDVLIGDWDRHSGQWQWGELTDPAHPGRVRYSPVPKDRDQTFFRISDGLVPWLMTRKFAVRHLVTFKKRIHDVHALTGQGRFVDQRGLSHMTSRDFDQAARFTQQHLPDSVLERAVHQLPPAVYALEGPRLLRDLKARRKQLPEVAHRYYLLKARKPIVAGTDQADHFMVQRTTDSTIVSIYSRSLGADSLFYHRTFFGRETHHITIEGLDGNDVFDLTGNGLPLVLHGGAGDDVVRPSSNHRLKFEQHANGKLPVPAPRTKKERFDNYDRLTDE
jgi:hypothetical protein